MVHLSCGVRFTRGMLFALNIIFFLIGLSVMGLGIYLKSSKSYSAISEIYSISKILGDQGMQWVGIGMIIAGILTACLAAFGCLGAILKNRCCLYTYTIFLTLIVLFEFVAVIVILVYRNNLWKTYDSGFMEVFHQAYTHNQTETIKVIENLEREFQCCGVEGASDYMKYGHPIPLACYPNQTQTFQPYFQGCAEAVIKWIWNEIPIFAGVIGAILFIEIFGIIASLVLGVAISHSSFARGLDSSHSLNSVYDDN